MRNRDSLSDLAMFKSAHVITNKCVLVTNETFAVLPWLALFYGFRNRLEQDEWWYCKTLLLVFSSLISEPWYVLKQGKPQGKKKIIKYFLSTPACHLLAQHPLCVLIALLAVFIQLQLHLPPWVFEQAGKGLSIVCRVFPVKLHSRGRRYGVVLCMPT